MFYIGFQLPPTSHREQWRELALSVSWPASGKTLITISPLLTLEVYELLGHVLS